MTALTGLKEISQYTRRGKEVVKRLVRLHRFPAVVIEGQWQSDTELIDRWVKAQIEEAVNSNT
jgi:hypothetical protein